MLFEFGRVAEPAVVGQVYEKAGARGGDGADEFRDGVFITYEDGEVEAPETEDHGLVSWRIVFFVGDESSQEREVPSQRGVLAEWNEVEFVVPEEDFAGL